MLFKIPPLLEVWSATVCLQVPAPLCLGLWVGSGDLCVQMGFPKKLISQGCSWDSTVAVAMGWNHLHPSWWSPGVSSGCFFSWGSWGCLPHL